MEINENEPEDIKKATPVESAILAGNKDEKKQTKGNKRKSAATTRLDVDDPLQSRGRRCNLYRDRFPLVEIKTKKPCHTKVKIICRENLSKDEYIDVLSSPKKSRESRCKFFNKRKRSVPPAPSQRLAELAKPKLSHIKDLLETWGGRLRPEIIDAVQKSIETNCALSPEQMEAYYDEKSREDCVRVRRVKRKKCYVKEKKKNSNKRYEDCMDPEAVCEEYEMAQRFVRHIISHLKNCPYSPEDHYDLTETILSQLGGVLDYRPSGDGDRKFQMMFLLANGIACWVHGLNVVVAEKLAKQQQEVEEDEEDEESEEEDVEEEKEEGGVLEEEDEEEDGERGKEKLVEEDGETGEEKFEEEDEEEKEQDEDVKSEQGDDEESLRGEDVIGDENLSDNDVAPEPENSQEETDVNVTGEKEESELESEGEEESMTLPEEKVDTEAPAESIENDDEEIGEKVETEDEGKDEIEEPEDEKTMEEIEETEEETTEHLSTIISMEEPGLAIKKLGEGDLFGSEIPFVTFGKIMEVAVKFLEKFEEAETTEVRRRLQNAVLKKLTNLVLAEVPDALDNNMKAVLEVLAENVAVFLEETLPESKVNEVEEMAPEVESKEVRDWGNWLESVMDTATNWGKWIHDKVNEAEEKARLKVTRGDWQDWTSTVNAEALQWRMFNLDTKHRMHHADLNLAYKKVVHRGGPQTRNSIRTAKLAPYTENNETEIENYDLSNDEQSHDKTEESEQHNGQENSIPDVTKT